MFVIKERKIIRTLFCSQRGEDGEEAARVKAWKLHNTIHKTKGTHHDARLKLSRLRRHGKPEKVALRDLPIQLETRSASSNVASPHMMGTSFADTRRIEDRHKLRHSLLDSDRKRKSRDRRGRRQSTSLSLGNVVRIDGLLLVMEDGKKQASLTNNGITYECTSCASGRSNQASVDPSESRRRPLARLVTTVHRRLT